MLLNRGMIFVPEVANRKILTHKPLGMTKNVANTPQLGSKSSPGPRFELHGYIDTPHAISRHPQRRFLIRFFFFEQIHIEVTLVQIWGPNSAKKQSAAGVEFKTLVPDRSALPALKRARLACSDA